MPRRERLSDRFSACGYSRRSSARLAKQHPSPSAERVIELGPQLEEFGQKSLRHAGRPEPDRTWSLSDVSLLSAYPLRPKRGTRPLALRRRGLATTVAGEVGARRLSPFLTGSRHRRCYPSRG